MANLDKLKNLNPKQFMKYNRIEKVQVDETTVQNLKKKSTLCAMELKRILLDESNKRVLTKTGLSLNGKGIVNTAIAVVNSRENIDRYRVNALRTTTKAGFSFAIDFSGSMTHPDPSYVLKGIHTRSLFDSLCYAVNSIVDTLTPLGISSYVGAILFTAEDELRNFGASDNFIPIVLPIKHPTESKMDLKKSLALQPTTSTSLTSYARASIHMAKQLRDCNKRVAIYLTDGEDPNGKPYLKSLEEQAKAEGIELVLAVLSQDEMLVQSYADLGINFVHLKDAEDFVPTLCGVLKKLF
jgi:hypothetical protein